MVKRVRKVRRILNGVQPGYSKQVARVPRRVTKCENPVTKLGMRAIRKVNG